MPNRYGENETHTDNNPTTSRRREVSPHPDPQAAINQCTLCNNDGYRGTTTCDHTDHSIAATRGMNQIRTIMGWKQPQTPPESTTDPKNRTP